MHTIEKWSLNNHKLTTARAKLDAFDDVDLFKKGGARVEFSHTNNEVTLPTYFYIVDGMIGEEDTFYDRIFTLDQKLAKSPKLYRRFDNGLDKNIARDTIDSIQNEWSALEKGNRINAHNIVRFIDLHRTILKINNAKTRACVIEGFKNYFEEYFEIHGSNFRAFEVKNILVHLVYWSNLYINDLFVDFDYSGEVPKLFYFGKISKREAYFLDFANRVGVDVVFIDTESCSPFDKIDSDKKRFSWSGSPRQIAMREFPSQLINATISTQAFAASEELRETLHAEDSMFYRPWQFIDYSVRAMNLITTYEEIQILAGEKSMMRSGWEVGHGVVTIPSFFAKVAGVHSNINKYYDELNTLKKLPKTLFVDHLPLCPVTQRLMKQEYYSVCGRDYKIDVQKLLIADCWPYKHLQKHIQNVLANSIKEFCNFVGIKRQKRYANEEQRLIIFSTLMTLKAEYLQLLQQFDYPKEVPKCIIYNNELNGELSFEDSILIFFLSSVGIDVFIFNPSGQNDIEIYIDESNYNKHHLEDVAFNLPFKSFSVFGKYIK